MPFISHYTLHTVQAKPDKTGQEQDKTLLLFIINRNKTKKAQGNTRMAQNKKLTVNQPYLNSIHAIDAQKSPSTAET